MSQYNVSDPEEEREWKTRKTLSRITRMNHQNYQSYLSGKHGLEGGGRCPRKYDAETEAGDTGYWCEEHSQNSTLSAP